MTIPAVPQIVFDEKTYRTPKRKQLQDKMLIGKLNNLMETETNRFESSTQTHHDIVDSYSKVKLTKIDLSRAKSHKNKQAKQNHLTFEEQINRLSKSPNFRGVVEDHRNDVKINNLLEEIDKDLNELEI